MRRRRATATIGWLVAFLLIGTAWFRSELRGPRDAPAAEAEAAVLLSAPAAPPGEGSIPLSRRAWLEGIVVDAFETPVRGAEVLALWATSEENTIAWQLDPDFRCEHDVAASARTGDDGRFRFDLPRGIPFELESDAGRQTGFAEGFAHAGDDVRIVLGDRNVVRGWLTRASDGKPIADALVRAYAYPSYAKREARSAADGSYQVSFPFEGLVYLDVLPHAEEALQGLLLALDPYGSVQVDLALPDGVPVVGRVTEEGTGRALAGAIVGEGWQFRRSAVSDAEGRYRLEGIGGADAYGLTAKARGHGMRKRLELPAVRDGVLHVDFELPLARAATGRVIDGEGEAIAGACIVADGSCDDENREQHERLQARSDADGRFRLEELSPGRDHALTVSALGFATLDRRLPDPPEGTGEIALEDFELARPALVAGRVLGPDGDGLPVAEVTIEGELAAHSTCTDASGRFAFGDLGPGRYRLHGGWFGRPLEPELEVVFAEGAIREGLELRLPGGLPLSGRVLDERRAGVGDVCVDATPCGSSTSSTLEPFESTEEDGTFRFEDVPAGKYALGISAACRARAAFDASWLDAAVASVEAGSSGIEIVLSKGTKISGRVLNVDGDPLVDRWVIGYRADESTRVSHTDAHGRFELLVPLTTCWDIEVWSPLQRSSTPLWTEHGVGAGRNDLVLQLCSR